MSEEKALARAKDLAYRRLAVRARSRAEILDYLKKKEIAEDIALDAVADLERYGYIDDAKFARQFARYLIASKGLSRYALGMELRRKGVPAADIESAVSEIFSEGGESEEAVALRAAEKKVASLGGLDRERARRRLADYLRRRGFGFGVIKDVLKRLGW